MKNYFYFANIFNTYIQINSLNQLFLFICKNNIDKVIRIDVSFIKAKKSRFLFFILRVFHSIRIFRF